jgi:hypothetical protein
MSMRNKLAQGGIMLLNVGYPVNGLNFGPNQWALRQPIPTRAQ